MGKLTKLKPSPQFNRRSHPHRPELFSEAFVNTNIVVDARIVGDPDDVAGVVKRLWKPGMKPVVVTYCQTPEEQAVAYERIHEICRT